VPKVIELNPQQAEFVQCMARFVGFFGGIGSGKTAGGAVKAIKKIPDGDGIVVGSDFPHFTKSLWPEFAKWLPWSRVINKHLNHPFTSEKILKIQCGKHVHKIYYGGMEEASAWAGPSVNWAWADEFRRKPTRQHFDILAGRIRVGPNPQLWLTTTPRASLRGQYHWLYNVFVQRQFPEEVLEIFRSSNRELVTYFTAPTSENADNLDPLYLASLQGLYSGKYAQQELGGAFISFEGIVFSEFNEIDNVTEDAEYIPGIAVEWGVDEGFTPGHPRVILLAQVVPPYINIFDEYVITHEMPEVSLDNVLALPYQKPVVARVDSSAAELIRRLWDREIDTQRGSHDVIQGINHLRPFIRDGRGQVHVRFHPRCGFSIQEIQAYSYPDTTESRLSPSSARAAKPLKEADNAADALRYLTWPKDINLLMSWFTDEGAQDVLRLPEPVSTEPQQRAPQETLIRMGQRSPLVSLFGSKRRPRNRSRNRPIGRPSWW